MIDREDSMNRLLIAASVLVLVAAACGDGDATSTTAGDAGDTTMATTTLAPTTTQATTTLPSTTAATTSTTAPGSTTTAPSDSGAPYDLWVPQPDEGAIVGVIGVRHDDVLNVRSGPGIEFDVVTTLDPTSAGVSGTGEGWQLPSGAVWWRIEAGGVTGWANQQYLSRLSDVDDVTSVIVERVGEIPVAETMLDLGLAAVGGYAGSDVSDDTVVSVAPTVGDLGEITLDVVGLGDDTTAGFRIHVFGQPTDGGEGFSLMAAEATVFCQRGVDGGRCI
jgi:hypothetical protein